MNTGKTNRGQHLLAMFLVCLALFAVSALAQQPPQPPEGFVPASSVQGQEQLPAAPLVITAYSVVWLLVFGYLWSIWRRIARAEQDVAEVTRRVAGAQRR
jgi:CcmD family protein